MRMRSFCGFVASMGAALVLGGLAPAAGADPCRGQAGVACPRVVPGGDGVVEGDAGSPVLEIPVTLSEPSTKRVTVRWTTNFGPDVQPPEAAEPGADYQAARGTVTFEPGAVEATVAITVFGDDLSEGSEWIVVAFSHPRHAVMGGFWGLGFGVIDDDDPPLIASAPGTDPATVVEGDAGPQILQMPVTLSQPSTQTVTVDWRTVPFNLEDPPTGTEGVDYLAGAGTVTFPPGATETAIAITVLGDTAPERDESIVVELRNPRNGVLGPIPLGPIGFGVIIDDD
jgi:hypothetical protein